MKNARLAVCLFVLAIVLQVPTIASANPGLSVQPIDTTTVTPADLVSTLVGSGVSFTNVNYAGADIASGKFSGGAGIIGFDSGILLTSGSATNVVGPNMSDSKTTVNSTPGDADLEAIPGIGTGNSHDAAALQFDFTPTASPIFFSFVFASEEYNEFANSSFNDVFAFFVNGTNCAMVPGTSDPVSVNTINGGNPFGTNPQHPEFFRNNDYSEFPPGAAPIDTEMDGLTTVLTCEANVTPNSTNHMKLAVADTGDSSLDSAVFLQANSLSTTPPRTLSVAVTGNGNVVSDPAGINCPGIEGGSCSTQFPDGTGVTLTATPAASNVFAGWGGNCSGTSLTCTLTMDADKSVTASFEPAASADLSITKTDTASGYGPNTVSSGNVVAYKVDASNAGPDTATGVQVTDTVTGGGGIVGASGTGWACPGPFSATTTTTTCTRASIANGATAPAITVQVKAPTTSVNTTISDTAAVSGNENDPNSADNSATDSTPVTQSSTNDAAAGFCSGATNCTISTDPNNSGATPGDPTVSSIFIPANATADPQSITMKEYTSATLCGGSPCQGQVLEFTSNPQPTFGGVTDPNYPAVVTMIFDRSVKQGSQVYVKKGNLAPKLVRNCTTAGIASPHPCVSAKNITLGNGDREFIILFLEGDPIIGKR